MPAIRSCASCSIGSSGKLVAVALRQQVIDHVRDVRQPRMRGQLARMLVQDLELVEEGNEPIDLGVRPGGAAHADGALERRQLVHRGRGDVTHEGPREVLLARARRQREHPEHVQRDIASALTGAARQRCHGDSALDAARLPTLAERREAEPIAHQGHFPVTEEKPRFDAVEIARAGSDSGVVRSQTA